MSEHANDPTLANNQNVSDELVLTEVVVDAQRLKLSGLRFGDPSKPKLLALHGWLDNAASFVGLAPWLAAHYDVVALDHAGHGKSEHRAGGASGGAGTYYFVDYVMDTVCALDSLGWERCALLGHSMGAGVAAMAASVARDRIEALVCIEGLGPMTSSDEDAPEVLARAIGRVADYAPREARVYATRDEAHTLFMKARSKLSGPHAERLFSRALVDEEAQENVRFRYDPRLRAPSPIRFNEPQILAFLARIQAPVTVFSAGQGWPFDRAAIERRLGVIPKIATDEVDGHHHVHVESPELLGDKVLRALGAL